MIIYEPRRPSEPPARRGFVVQRRKSHGYDTYTVLTLGASQV